MGRRLEFFEYAVSQCYRLESSQAPLPCVEEGCFFHGMGGIRRPLVFRFPEKTVLCVPSVPVKWSYRCVLTEDKKIPLLELAG